MKFINYFLINSFKVLTILFNVNLCTSYFPDKFGIKDFLPDDLKLLGIHFDYNLNTGKIEYEHSFEDCSEEQNLKPSKNINLKLYKKLPKLPLMKDFVPGDNQLNLTKKEEFYY